MTEGAKRLLGAAALAALALPAGAEPYLAAREARACAACHVSPSGSGPRNFDGLLYAEHLTFPREDARPLELEQPRLQRREVPVTIGGDARVDLQQNAAGWTFGLPQAVLYAHVQPRDILDLVYAVEQAGTKELYLVVRDLPLALYFRAGRFTLPYGLLLGDATSLLAQTTGFGTHAQDVGLETGGSGPGGFWHAALTNGSGPGTAVRSLTGQAGLPLGFGFLGASLHRTVTWAGEERWRYGLFGWWRLPPAAILYEVDEAVNLAAGAVTRRRVAHLEVEWDAEPALHPSGTVEWQDPDVATAGDDVFRLALGLRLFPMSFLELKGLLAVEQRPGGSTLTFQGQTHVYF